MDDTSKIIELSKLLREKEAECSELKRKFNQLKDLNINLEIENNELRFNSTMNPKNPNHSKLYFTEKIENLEKENKMLHEEFQKKEIQSNHEMYFIRKDADDQVRKLKNYIDSMHMKIDKINAIERIYNIQGKYIIDIDEEFIKQKENFEEKLRQKDVVNGLKTDTYKKNMMKQLMKAKKNLANREEDGKERDIKLTKLQHYELIKELENQSQLVDQLILAKSNLEKKVMMLQNDVQIHNQLEKNLMVKNKKMSYLVINQNKMSEKNLESKSNKSLNFDIEGVSNMNSAEKKIKLNFSLNPIRINKIEDSDKFRTLIEKNSQLLRELNDKKSEISLLKINNGILTNKLESYEQKKAYLLKCVDDVLQVIINEEKLKTKSEGEIKTEDNIKTVPFEKLSLEKKYLLLNEVKHRLNSQDDSLEKKENLNFKETTLYHNFKSKKSKFSLSKTRNNFLSINSTSTDNKSFVKKNISFK